MRSIILALSAATALATPGFAAAQQAVAASQSPHTFTANAALLSDYRFRGISQTFKLPAIQGGFDYSHSSGLYLGTFGSNVSGNLYWNGNGMEWDLYGGYKWEPAKGITVDLGTLYYLYPGAKTVPPVAPAPAGTGTGTTKYDTWEIYGIVGYKWYTAKLSYSLTDYFGLNNTAFTGTSGPTGAALTLFCGFNSDGTTATSNCYTTAPGNSKGSAYLDLSANIPFSGFTLVAHYGYASVRHWSKHSYSDWKLGVTKDVDGWVFGAAYVDSNAKKEWYRAIDTNRFLGPAGSTRDLGTSTIVLSVSRTF
jgi:uncharacterized protein (TIGR02001 family)